MTFDPRLPWITLAVVVLLAAVWWRRFRRPEYADEPNWVRLADFALVLLLVLSVAYMWLTTPPPWTQTRSVTWMLFIGEDE